MEMSKRSQLLCVAARQNVKQGQSIRPARSAQLIRVNVRAKHRNLRQKHRSRKKEKPAGLNPAALVLCWLCLGGGGVFAYLKLVKNKPKTKGNDSLDDYDYGEEDSEEWETEDEESDEFELTGQPEEDDEDRDEMNPFHSVVPISNMMTHAGRRAGGKLPVLIFLYPTTTPAMVAGVMETPAPGICHREMERWLKGKLKKCVLIIFIKLIAVFDLLVIAFRIYFGGDILFTMLNKLQKKPKQDDLLISERYRDSFIVPWILSEALFR